MKTEANDPIHAGEVLKPIESDPDGMPVWHNTNGLTKREYLAASIGIQNEVADMIKKPDPDYLSLITGVKQPESQLPTKDKDIKEWAKYWFSVEAALKVIKADALIAQLNK